MRQRLGEGCLQHFLEVLIRSVLGHVTITSAQIYLHSKSDLTPLRLKLFKISFVGPSSIPMANVGWPCQSPDFFSLLLL